MVKERRGGKYRAVAKSVATHIPRYGIRVLRYVVMRCREGERVNNNESQTSSQHTSNANEQECLPFIAVRMLTHKRQALETTGG